MKSEISKQIGGIIGRKRAQPNGKRAIILLSFTILSTARPNGRHKTSEQLRENPNIEFNKFIMFVSCEWQTVCASSVCTRNLYMKHNAQKNCRLFGVRSFCCFSNMFVNMIYCLYFGWIRFALTVPILSFIFVFFSCFSCGRIYVQFYLSSYVHVLLLSHKYVQSMLNFPWMCVISYSRSYLKMY